MLSSLLISRTRQATTGKIQHEAGRHCAAGFSPGCIDDGTFLETNATGSHNKRRGLSAPFIFADVGSSDERNASQRCSTGVTAAGTIKYIIQFHHCLSLTQKRVITVDFSFYVFSGTFLLIHCLIKHRTRHKNPWA